MKNNVNKNTEYKIGGSFVTLNEGDPLDSSRESPSSRLTNGRGVGTSQKIQIVALDITAWNIGVHTRPAECQR